MAKTDRIFQLLSLLSGARGFKEGDLARRLGVSVRTVYRDLADLQRLNDSIEETEQGWRLKTSAGTRPVDLDPAERALVRVALGNPALRRLRRLRRALEALDAKLAPPRVSAAGAAAALELATVDRSGEVPEAVFEALERAIGERAVCEVEYQTLAEARPRRRRFDPLRLFQRAEAWYLAAHCHENEEVRIFRLDRITAVEPTGGRFVPPENFDLTAFLADTWTISKGGGRFDVELRFAAALRPLFEHSRHHETEQKEFAADGSCRYRVRVGQLEEIARWIVGFGSAATVIAPEALRTAVRSLAAGTLEANSAAPEPPPKGRGARRPGAGRTRGTRR
ncbi:MAG: transcriptional regulator [Thermoanaerobaculia bacterium]|nr:transcriptional regulator [Thermoanaerobaculia bacterium]